MNTNALSDPIIIAAVIIGAASLVLVVALVIYYVRLKEKDPGMAVAGVAGSVQPVAGGLSPEAAQKLEAAMTQFSSLADKVTALESSAGYLVKQVDSLLKSTENNDVAIGSVAKALQQITQALAALKPRSGAGGVAPDEIKEINLKLDGILKVISTLIKNEP